MKKYNCEVCNYHTDIRCNFIKHESTKRHHKNKEKKMDCTEISHKNTEISHKMRNIYTFSKHICSHCNSEYVSKFSLDRHLKTCSKKIMDDYESKIKVYEMRIETYEKQVDDYKNQISELLKQNEIFINENMKITNSVLKIAENQSMAPKKQINNNHTQYIINNYKHAPNLEFPMVNWSNERMENYVKLGAVKGLSKIITDHWVDNIPPEERSIWNIDYSRNKFLIRVNDSWIIDVNASKFQEITIDKIYSIFIDYMKTSNKQAFEMVELMSFMCDIRNKDMGLKALKDAGKYLIYDNEKYKNDPPITF